jgi:hypothetical protein
LQIPLHPGAREFTCRQLSPLPFSYSLRLSPKLLTGNKYVGYLTACQKVLTIARVAAGVFIHLIKGRSLTTPQFNYALRIGLLWHWVRLKRPAQELVPMLYVSKLVKICVVCHRIADMPAPKVPSVQRKCAQCHARIWVAKGAPAAPKVCLKCVTGAATSASRRRKSEQHRLRERRQHVH